MSIKARVRIIFILGGLALLVVMAVSAYLLASVASRAAREAEEPATVMKVIVVTATPRATRYVTPETRFIGVDFAGPVDITALYHRGGTIAATAVASDVVYIEGKLYQVYHTTPDSGEFAFDLSEVLTLTLNPIFPTTALPDEFPEALRIQPQ